MEFFWSSPSKLGYRLRTSENTVNSDRRKLWKCGNRQRHLSAARNESPAPISMICLLGLFATINYGAAGPNKNVILTVYRNVVAYSASDVTTVHGAQDR